MSSNCYLRVPSSHRLNHETWELFARSNNIVYSPNTVGGETWYAGEVEVHFLRTREGYEVAFSTFYMEQAMSEVARLAVRAWKHFGGSMTASPEILAWIVRPEAPTE